MNQNKNTWIVIAIVVVVIMGIVIMQKKNSGPVPLIPGTAEPAYVVPQEGAPETKVEQALPNQTASAPVEPGEKTYVVVYTDSGFTPNTLDISKETVVTFKNLSSAGMWVASASHLTRPQHDEYPEKGGCYSSKFDACQEIKLNQVWRFKFDIPGTWKYHDHLNPGRTGIINVSRF